MVATITTIGTEIMPPNTALVRLTTVATTDTYVCPYFSKIEACIGNNESATSGVGVGVSGNTITLTVGVIGHVVTLFIAGVY